ncbi:LysR family transcriptional regulator [Paracoccus seriniphilus]|uniref:Transcriptional regulator /transcriptional regulator, LysR family n=1 Tax=Paracoccus seriniphilus TaxID=184748 RepID=A0A239Q384_9RHOB|nr:LysR family transcriptional regulator [Paracoccus seriniphilus]WCR15626.1 LysR family transcriptional regulator [Paracoccus seriniphilus]SNT76652.1 transcriptional regulator /transcriptional regulator, LysR family [Paracoccus seriniphilus]
MQQHQIVGFYHLIKLGSFTKAAEATYRTQSAVTQQIRALEQELGCKLVEQVSRGVVVATTEGKELFQFAEMYMREQRAVVERIHDIRDETERKLVIAAPIDTMSKVLPSYVKAFWKSRPDVKLRLIECSMDAVVKGIRSQEFDLGLGLLTHVPSDLTQIRWLPMHHYIIAHDSHDIWNTPVNLESISRYNLILPPITEYAQTGSALLSALSKKGLPFNVTLEASSNDRCIEYARNGMGIFFALCCDEMLVDLPKDMRTKKLQHLFRSENIGVFFDGTRKLRSRDEQFLDQLGLDR